MIKRIEWIVAGRIILIEVAGVISAEDVNEISKRTAHMVSTEGEPPYVHFLYDVRQRDAISPDILSISRLRSMASSTNLLGWSLVVDPNPHVIMNSLASILMQMLGIRLRIFTNMQAAVDFIWDMDKTLPGLKPEVS